MTPLLLALLAAGPCVYWTQGIDSRAVLEAAGVTRICVPPGQVETWKGAGFAAVPVSDSDLASRESLPVPGITARAGLASPTRAPWVVASGWRIARAPAAKYAYAVPPGKGALAAAEAFAYGSDAVLTIDPGDLPAVGAMMTFLAALPASNLPPVADFGVVDDGSAVAGEVMNLLARRNLLFQGVRAPGQYPLDITIGSAEFPAQEAADPSAFAQKVRAKLKDERRSLRIYGSEVVIARFTGGNGQVRLHLLNYGGRDIEGLRIRLRGIYRAGEVHIAGSGPVALADHVVTAGFTEFSLPRLATYAVIDLK